MDWRQGSSNGNARLHEVNVHDIKLKWLRGASLRQLASEYNCSHITIKNIVLGKSWKHVEVTRNELQAALGLTGPFPSAVYHAPAHPQ